MSCSEDIIEETEPPQETASQDRTEDRDPEAVRCKSGLIWAQDLPVTQGQPPILYKIIITYAKPSTGPRRFGRRQGTNTVSPLTNIVLRPCRAFHSGV